MPCAPAPRLSSQARTAVLRLRSLSKSTVPSPLTPNAPASEAGTASPGAESSRLRAGGQPGKHLGHRQPKGRVHHFRCNLGQRLQNKPPLVHLRMRQRQLRRSHYGLPIQQKIQVDHPRPLDHHALALPPHPPLHIEQPAHQLQRLQLCLQQQCPIQKPRLRHISHRLRLREGRNGPHHSQDSNPLYCLAQVRLPVTKLRLQVRSQRNRSQTSQDFLKSIQSHLIEE